MSLVILNDDHLPTIVFCPKLLWARFLQAEVDSITSQPAVAGAVPHVDTAANGWLHQCTFACGMERRSTRDPSGSEATAQHKSLLQDEQENKG